MKYLLAILSIFSFNDLYAQSNESFVDSSYLKEMRASRIDSPHIDATGEHPGTLYLYTDTLSDGRVIYKSKPYTDDIHEIIGSQNQPRSKAKQD